MTRLAVVAAIALACIATVRSADISIKARSVQPGEVVVVSIPAAGDAAAVRVRAFGQDVPAYRVGDEWRAIVGIDLDVKAGKYPITAEPGGQSYELNVAAKRFPTRRLTVNEAFVTPPASEQPRIEREAALLAATWKASSAARLWTTGFVRPVPHDANSAFGTRSIFNGKPRNPHGGADFLSPAGTPIHSPNAGRIVVARNLYYSGNTVIIDHGLGLFSMLAHLSRIDVKEGELVSPGQVLGLVGATGRVTGPHLHWAVRAGDARVDPLSLLALLGS